MFSLKVFLFYQFYLPACSWPLLLQLFPQQRQHRKGMRCWQFPFSPNHLFCSFVEVSNVFPYLFEFLSYFLCCRTEHRLPPNCCKSWTVMSLETLSRRLVLLPFQGSLGCLESRVLSVITWQHDYTHKKNYQNEFHVTYHYGCIQLFLFKCVAQLFCFQLKIMRS